MMSCAGTSHVTTRSETLTILSIGQKMRTRPGPFSCLRTRPSRNTTARSYSRRMFRQLNSQTTATRTTIATTGSMTEPMSSPRLRPIVAMSSRGLCAVVNSLRCAVRPAARGRAACGASLDRPRASFNRLDALHPRRARPSIRPQHHDEDRRHQAQRQQHRRRADRRRGAPCNRGDHDQGNGREPESESLSFGSCFSPWIHSWMNRRGLLGLRAPPLVDSRPWRRDPRSSAVERLPSRQPR